MRDDLVRFDSYIHKECPELPSPLHKRGRVQFVPKPRWIDSQQAAACHAAAPLLGSATMRRSPQKSWFFRAVLAAALVICGAWALNHFFPPPFRPALTTNEQNRQILQTYYRSAGARLVLVGTSLMYRLTAKYADAEGVSNVALPGESPVTDLRVVAAQSKTPNVVVVETNILPRAENVPLEAEFQPSLFAELARVRPLRWLAAWLNAPKAESMQQTRQRKQVILGQPPAPRQPASEYLVKGWNDRIPDEQMRITAREIVALADELERRGTKVFFIELPMTDEMSRTWLAARTREIMQQAIGERTDRVLQLHLDSDQLRWTDGAHLDERSAIIVLQAIEKEVRLTNESAAAAATLRRT
jgi:hypothetical protein